MFVSELHAVVGYFHTDEFENRRETYCAKCISNRADAFWDLTVKIKLQWNFGLHNTGSVYFREKRYLEGSNEWLASNAVMIFNQS